ncbi:MAG: lipoprotein [Rhizobiales bacterium]|nr:lipoprotein [Hyphomicrobiales bacterium]
MLARGLIVLLLAAVALSGCGRRGALEDPGRDEAVLPLPPSGAVLVPAAPNDAAAGKLSTLDPGSPGAQEQAEATPDAAPARRFLLDPLI